MNLVFTGNDTIAMYGGKVNDTMTYNVTGGSDNVTINGAQGDDNLTINKMGQKITLVDNNGKVIFKSGDGGSTITITNIEHIKVIGDNGERLYTYNDNTTIVPTAITPLLLGN
jgi:Ca2+-binding RTX toxin-like protein